MSTKKTVKPESAVKSAAEEREQKINEQELLEGLPELLAPGKLRQRTVMELQAIIIDYQDTLKSENSADTDIVKAGMEATALIDEWAERIAVDKGAYEEWAMSQAGNFDVWFALANRYLDTSKK